jgi:hypothetical protein
MFTDEFLDSLPSDPLKSLLSLCERFKIEHAAIPADKEVENYDQYLEAYAAFEAFIDVFNLNFPAPPLKGNKGYNIGILSSYVDETVIGIEKCITDEKFSTNRNRFRARFGGEFIYEFSDGDLSQVQTILNELRDNIAASELFDAKHKQRILNKLEALQRELHKKMSSLDKFWGLIGEAGVVLGKFGKDAKPFVDRIKELTRITWLTQARAEELPSGTTLPLLAPPKAIESDED